MRTRRFGSLGIEIPIIGLGTWNMEHDAPEQAMASIQRALEHGMIHIDTAELYGSGKVETLVGKAISGQRDRVFLTSKVLPDHAGFDATRRACEASLARLRTDHLDLYLLHWPGDVPLAETIRAFESLREAGKIRAWGVSNFDEADLEDALAIAGDGKIACNQVLYHLGDRTIERGVMPWCEQHDVAVVAYSPFGSRGGFEALSAAPVLAAIAARLGATPRQVALAFLGRRAFVIPKSSRPAHVDEIAGADRVTLDDASIAEIDAAFPVGPWRGLPML